MMLVRETFLGVKIGGGQSGLLQAVVLFGRPENGEAAEEDVRPEKLVARLHRDYRQIHRAYLLGAYFSHDFVQLVHELVDRRWRVSLELVEGENPKAVAMLADSVLVHVENELPASDKTTEIVFDVNGEDQSEVERALTKARVPVYVAPVDEESTGAAFRCLTRNPGWRFAPAFGRSLWRYR